MKTTLTKDEFIARSMAGEIVIRFAEKELYKDSGWYKIEDLYIDVEIKQ